MLLVPLCISFSLVLQGLSGLVFVRPLQFTLSVQLMYPLEPFQSTVSIVSCQQSLLPPLGVVKSDVVTICIGIPLETFMILVFILYVNDMDEALK